MKSRFSALQLDRFDFDQATWSGWWPAIPRPSSTLRVLRRPADHQLRSRLRSPAQAEDARQETFRRVLTTLKQRGGLKAAEHLGAFVNGVCNNVLFELYRAGMRTDRCRRTGPGRTNRSRPVESGMIAAEDRGACNGRSRPCRRKRRTSCAGCSSRNGTKTKFAPSWRSIGLSSRDPPSGEGEFSRTV